MTEIPSGPRRADWCVCYLRPDPPSRGICVGGGERNASMTQRMDIEALVTPDGMKARVVVKQNGNTVCNAITDDPQDLTDAIQKLGNARAAMGENIATQLEPVVRLPEVENPTWKIPNYTDGGD